MLFEVRNIYNRGLFFWRRKNHQTISEMSRRDKTLVAHEKVIYHRAVGTKCLFVQKTIIPKGLNINNPEIFFREENQRENNPGGVESKPRIQI